MTIDPKDAKRVHAEKSETERDGLQAKLDAAERWPEWLGEKPKRLKAKPIPLGYDVDGLVFHGDRPIETYEDHLKGALLDATRYAAVIEAKKSEQAATDDKDQRVEEWARKAARIMARSACDELGQPEEVIDNLTERLIPRGRALVNAGWTPPENNRQIAAKAWNEGYQAGVHDERIVAELDYPATPDRTNPYKEK